MTTPLPNPKYPIVVIDTDDPLSVRAVDSALNSHGATILVRSVEGHDNRGGYYFQIERTSEDQVTLYTFDRKDSFSMGIVQATAFINHCAGLMFSEDMLRYCQNVIDLKSD